MSQPLQQFGGKWTTEKLQRLREYLIAYQEALKNQPFKLFYIDAFAGLATTHQKPIPTTHRRCFDDLVRSDTREFVDGSARIALQIPRPFDHYVFVERDPSRHAELRGLKADFPHLAARIEPINEEANNYLTTLCKSVDWLRIGRRAVVFLDPFGMQVTWATISAIAETKAIDLWLLFPLGVAVNRMLPKHGQIPSGWRQRLDLMFGESDWYQAFYEKHATDDLFGGKSETTVKRAGYSAIADYFVKRLKTIFPHVAKNPLPLLNSAHCPLYLLCFAAGNPKGGPIAKRIAEHILKP